MLRSRQPDLRSLADEDLMPLVADGDARAFAVVFDRHGDPAFSLAYRMCGQQAMAEDIVQEAFLSLWRTGARYDSLRGSVRAWILRAVHNRAVDAFRTGVVKAGRDVSDEGLTERMAAPDRTEAEVASRDEATQLRAALAGIPAEQRKVIELAYFSGFTHAEIAAILKLPAGTVKGRMRLGLAKMRLLLSDPSEVAV